MKKSCVAMVFFLLFTACHSTNVNQPSILTQPQPHEKKLFKQISFKSNDSIILNFSAAPIFIISSQDLTTYKLTIPDFIPSSPSLLLPYFAPKNFSGLKFISARNSKEENLLIITLKLEEGFSLTALPNGNQIVIRTQYR